MEEGCKKVFDNFLAQYDVYNMIDEKQEEITKSYLDLFCYFLSNISEKKIYERYLHIADIKLAHDIPLSLMVHEMLLFKDIVFEYYLHKNQVEKLQDMIKLFYDLKNQISGKYLIHYINHITHLTNMRKLTVEQFDDDSLMKYYKYHLDWFLQIVNHIKSSSKYNFPELDANRCNFGTWITKVKQFGTCNEKCIDIVNEMHTKLHDIAHKIYDVLENKEYYLLYHYLQKCELLSLNIGTEMVLVDNMNINKMVSIDPLTQALNRSSLYSLFKKEYEYEFAVGSCFVLAICDLDDFKKINDTYGHLVGDEVLKRFVTIVKKSIRSSDMIIRFGGEEFVIILAATSLQNGVVVLEKIRESFKSAHLKAGTTDITTTVSIGAVEVCPSTDTHAKSIDEYLSLADANLYRAKRTGKDQVVI